MHDCFISNLCSHLDCSIWGFVHSLNILCWDAQIVIPLAEAILMWWEARVFLYQPALVQKDNLLASSIWMDHVRWCNGSFKCRLLTVMIWECVYHLQCFRLVYLLTSSHFDIYNFTQPPACPSTPLNLTSLTHSSLSSLQCILSLFHWVCCTA